MAFCQPCKTALVHYRAVGPLGSTNQNWLGAKLLSTPSACPPILHPLPPTHPLIHDTRDITGVVKISQKPAVNSYCAAESAMKHLLQSFSTYSANLASLHHSTGEPQLLQYFIKTIISWNYTECDNLVVFVNPVTYVYIHWDCHLCIYIIIIHKSI